jgi:hypothetical protein
MNTYEFSQDPNHKLPFLIIIIGLLVAFLLLSISCTEEKEYKEYTVSAVVYFENGRSDTVSTTIMSIEPPYYELYQWSSKSSIILILCKDKGRFDKIAYNVTHFKQIK